LIVDPDGQRIPSRRRVRWQRNPTVPTPLDALDLESLSDEELQRLIQLLMSERERRMGLEPGPEEPL
jgi:hypothetical protein